MLLLKGFRILFFIGTVSLAFKVPDSTVKFWRHLVESFVDKCIAETHPDLKDIQAMVNNDYVPATKEMGCFIKCLYVNLNVIDEIGNFDKDKMMAIKLPEATSELIDKCWALTADKNDVCYKALAYGNCLVRNLLH